MIIRAPWKASSSTNSRLQVFLGVTGHRPDPSSFQLQELHLSKRQTDREGFRPAVLTQFLSYPLPPFLESAVGGAIPRKIQFSSKRKKLKTGNLCSLSKSNPEALPLLPVLTQSTTILPSSLAPNTVFASSQGLEGRKTSTELTGTCGGFPVPRETTSPNFLTFCL